MINIYVCNQGMCHWSQAHVFITKKLVQDTRSPHPVPGGFWHGEENGVIYFGPMWLFEYCFGVEFVFIWENFTHIRTLGAYTIGAGTTTEGGGQTSSPSKYSKSEKSAHDNEGAREYFSIFWSYKLIFA